MALNNNQVYVNANKHGDLTVEQIKDIQKSLLISLRSKDAFWDKFCSHTAIGDGKVAYEWRKLNIKELKESDIANLAEGITPAGLKLEYMNFTVAPVDFGSWIGYTDKSKKYNFDDVVRDAKVVLGQRAFEEVEFRKAKMFVSGACTMTLVADSQGKKDGFMKSLLKARTFLKKNHVKPLRGNRYGCILTPEQAAQVLLDYAEQITHTSEKEAVIDGYLGELAGFILFECAHPIMYTSSTTGEGQSAVTTYKGYCLFIGKTEYGMPVQTVSFGNSSIEMYNNELGKAVSTDANGNVVADVLHQHGSVGYKAMGFAARILADEAILRAEYTLSEAPWENVVDDTARNGYAAKANADITGGAHGAGTISPTRP